MLSAVAARKARALQEQQQRQQATRSTGSQNGGGAPSTSREASVPAKRKSLDPSPSSSSSSGTPEVRKRARVKKDSSTAAADKQIKPKKKKKVNTKPVEEAKAKGKGKAKSPKKASLQRYFGPDLFKAGDDIIAVDSDTGSEGEDSDGGLSDSRFQGEDNGILSSDDEDQEQGTAKRRGARADDDDDSMEIDEPVTLSTFFPHTGSIATSASLPKTTPPLSTFTPILNENLFVLSSTEVSELNLPGSHTTLSPSSLSASLVLLPPHESICILGTCKITLLHGSLSLLGMTLHASPHPHRIYAPKSSPLPIIRCAFTSKRRSDSRSLDSLLHTLTLPGRVDIDEDTKTYGAVFLIQEMKTGVEGLGKICRPFLNVFEPSGLGKWDSAAGRGGLSVPGLAMVREQTPDLHSFVLPQTWINALDETLQKLGRSEDALLCGVYLVKGPKNTGKSTFARTLMNRLLERYERVAFLECDLGQSEFTPGGMVALNVISKPVFGPPFTHPTLPIAAHYIGSSTPRSSPEYYLDAVRALLQTYRLDLQTADSAYHGDQGYSYNFSHNDDADSDEDDGEGTEEDSDEDMDMDRTKNRMTKKEKTKRKIKSTIPLVINTMGWSKGLGADLTLRIEEWADPTHIFTFDNADADHALPTSSPLSPLSSRQGRTDKRFSAFYRHVHTGIIEREGTRVHVLDAPWHADGQSRFTAADCRTINVLSYFHAIFPSPPSSEVGSGEGRTPGLAQITAEAWTTHLPLLAMRPYEVDLSRAVDDVVLTGAGSEDVVAGEVGRVVNGGVVGLVRCWGYEGVGEEVGSSGGGGGGGGGGDVGEEEGSREGGRGKGGRRKTIPYTQHSPPPDPEKSTCVGLALIRGVAPHLIEPHNQSNDNDNDNDEHNVDLQLLTPTPPEMLGGARVFVKGEMELPIWGMLDYRVWEPKSTNNAIGTGTDMVEMEDGKTPFLQWGRRGKRRGGDGDGGVVGAERRRVRRNLMRRGQA